MFTVDLPFMSDDELRELLDLLGRSADWEPGEVELVEKAQAEPGSDLPLAKGNDLKRRNIPNRDRATRASRLPARPRSPLRLFAALEAIPLGKMSTEDLRKR